MADWPRRVSEAASKRERIPDAPVSFADSGWTQKILANNLSVCSWRSDDLAVNYIDKAVEIVDQQYAEEQAEAVRVFEVFRRAVELGTAVVM